MYILYRFELLDELQKEYKNADIELSVGDRKSTLIVKGKHYHVWRAYFVEKYNYICATIF